jgi:hypothetical protein
MDTLYGFELYLNKSSYQKERKKERNGKQEDKEPN